MRVMIDTNILISAALNAKGMPYMAFVKAVSAPNQGLICEQNIDEMRRIFNKKFPSKIQAFESFLSIALLTLELVPVPIAVSDAEHLVRDIKDRPLLRAALAANADVFVTGDKDFLEANIKSPKILTATEFVEKY